MLLAGAGALSSCFGSPSCLLVAYYGALTRKLAVGGLRVVSMEWVRRELQGWDVPEPSCASMGAAAAGAARPQAATWVPAAVEPLLPPAPPQQQQQQQQDAAGQPDDGPYGPLLQPSTCPPVRVLCEVPARWVGS